MGPRRKKRAPGGGRKPIAAPEGTGKLDLEAVRRVLGGESPSRVAIAYEVTPQAVYRYVARWRHLVEPDAGA